MMAAQPNRDAECTIHGAGRCDCPAYLVTMGWMDLEIELRLQRDPAFGEELEARLRRGGDHRASE